jgi:hypothetical protein
MTLKVPDGAPAAPDGAPSTGTVTTPPAGATPTAPAAGVENGDADTEEPMSLEEARKLRRESNELRKRIKAAEDKTAAEEDAKRTEAERLEKQNADLKAANAKLLEQMQERTVRLTTVEAAARLGFRNPEVAYKLLDIADIEFTDSGDPKNVEKLLKALLEKEPYLAKPAGAGDFGGGNRGPTPSGKPDMSTLIKRGFGRG